MIEIQLEALDILLVLVSMLFGFVWAPKTWTPGELVTASSMNTNVRDHLNESLRTQSTALTGTQNNFALDGPFAYLQCNNASALTLTGALVDSGNLDGARVIIEAINQAVTLKNQDAGSTTSNRFITPSGDLVIASSERVLLVYDLASSRWRVNRADAAQLTQALADITTAEADITALELVDGTWARVYNNAAISIADATFTALTFNSERFDSAGLHSTSTDTSRIVAPATGKYMIGGAIIFAADATGVRSLDLIRGGATGLARVQVNAASAGETALSISTLVVLSTDDYVEIRAHQTSGGALDVTAQTELSPEFWLHRVD